MTLYPFDGPPCTRCGCRDTDITREPSSVQDSTGTQSWPVPGAAKCNHCQRGFTFTEMPTPPKPVPKIKYYAGPSCPECGTEDAKTHTTRKKTRARVRYHACEKCGHKFKTSEATADDVEPERAMVG
jgi:Zn ribbon nucleic-acid-binding protein